MCERKSAERARAFVCFVCSFLKKEVFVCLFFENFPLKFFETLNLLKMDKEKIFLFRHSLRHAILEKRFRERERERETTTQA